jgi:hypothetical protein
MQKCGFGKSNYGRILDRFRKKKDIEKNLLNEQEKVANEAKEKINYNAFKTECCEDYLPNFRCKSRYKDPNHTCKAKKTITESTTNHTDKPQLAMSTGTKSPCINLYISSKGGTKKSIRELEEIVEKLAKKKRSFGYFVKPNYQIIEDSKNCHSYGKTIRPKPKNRRSYDKKVQKRRTKPLRSKPRRIKPKPRRSKPKHLRTRKVRKSLKRLRSKRVGFFAD